VQHERATKKENRQPEGKSGFQNIYLRETVFQVPRILSTRAEGLPMPG
jgi:hypothetical protein